MKKFKQRLKENKTFFFLSKLIIYFSSIFILTLYGNLRNVGEFFYDAGRYWYLSSFFRDINGKFSLLYYTEELRGYLFPLILFTYRELFGSYLETYSLLIPLFNAVIISSLVLILLPELVKDLFGIKLSWVRRLALLGIFFFIWRGYVLYPLSDIPAFFLVLIYTCLLVKVLNTRKTKITLLIKVFLIGLMLSAVYFIRPVYLINVPIVFGSIGIFVLRLIYRDKKKLFYGFLMVVCLLAGAIIPALPQYYINSNNFDKKTFLVSSGLYSNQLVWGLKMQKYETNVNTDVYTYKQVIFEDPQYNLIYKENYDLYSEKFTDGDIKFVLMHMIRNYPLDMVTIYTRHFFNGLDIRYPTVYLFNVFQISLSIMLLNYTLIFLFIFLKKPLNCFKVNLSKLATIVLFTFPVLLALPGAVEPRFFLPFHLLIYTIVVTVFPCRRIGKEDIIKYTKSIYTYKWIIAYMTFVIFCLTLSALVGTTLKESGILLHNNL